MQATARIYSPSKTAMQSGRGRAEGWILEYAPAAAKAPESLMGWTASGDTLAQIRLKFETLEEAKRHAEAQGLVYSVSSPQERKIKPRNYGDNFKYVPVEDKK